MRCDRLGGGGPSPFGGVREPCRGPAPGIVFVGNTLCTGLVPTVFTSVLSGEIQWRFRKPLSYLLLLSSSVVSDSL